MRDRLIQHSVKIQTSLSEAERAIHTNNPKQKDYFAQAQALLDSSIQLFDTNSNDYVTMLEFIDSIVQTLDRVGGGLLNLKEKLDVGACQPWISFLNLLNAIENKYKKINIPGQRKISACRLLGEFLLSKKSYADAEKYCRLCLIYNQSLFKQFNFSAQQKKEMLAMTYSQYYPQMALIAIGQQKLSDAKNFAAEARRYCEGDLPDILRYNTIRCVIDVHTQIAVHVFKHGYYEDALYWLTEIEVLCDEMELILKNAKSQPLVIPGVPNFVDFGEIETAIKKARTTKTLFMHQAKENVLKQLKQYVDTILLNLEIVTRVDAKDNAIFLSFKHEPQFELIGKLLASSKLTYAISPNNACKISCDGDTHKLIKFLKKYAAALNAISVKPPVTEKLPSEVVVNPNTTKEEKLARHADMAEKRELGNIPAPTAAPEKPVPVKTEIEIEWKSKNYKPLTKEKPQRYFRIYGDPNIITYGFFNQKKLVTKVPNMEVLKKGKAVAERGLVLPNKKSPGRQGIVYTGGQKLTEGYSKKDSKYNLKVKMNGLFSDDRFLGKNVSEGVMKINGEKQNVRVELVEIDEYVHKAHKAAKRM